MSFHMSPSQACPFKCQWGHLTGHALTGWSNGNNFGGGGVGGCGGLVYLPENLGKKRTKVK